MVLERLDGKDTAKLLGNDTFHDIHYIREMLFSVFCALDVSQKQLGFHHSDLRLPNIMDIGPEPAEPGQAKGQQPLTFPGKSVMSNQEGPGQSILFSMPGVYSSCSIHCCFPKQGVAPAPLYDLGKSIHSRRPSHS